MPNIKSAKKALRQNIKRREHNMAKKKDLKGVIKDYRKLVESKKLEDARTKLSTVYKKLDKAAKTNLIKDNTAARLKSRLTKLLGR